MTVVTEETVARVVRLDESALTEAKAILFRSYKNDPTFKSLFEHDRLRFEQRLRATIREYVSMHVAMGQALVGLALDNHLIAVALITSPQVRVDLSKQFSWRARMVMSAGMYCTTRYTAFHKALHEHIPRDTYHELPLFGVDSSYRGMGYGRQLMQELEVISKQNPKSTGIVISTGDPQYAAFFNKIGYQTLGTASFEDIEETILHKDHS